MYDYLFKELCETPLNTIHKYGYLVSYGWIKQGVGGNYWVKECPSLIVKKGVLPQTKENEIISFNKFIREITKITGSENKYKEVWEYAVASILHSKQNNTIGMVLLDDILQNEFFPLSPIDYQMMYENKLKNLYIKADLLNRGKINDEIIHHHKHKVKSTDRNSVEYKHFVHEVLSRDSICQCCGFDKKLEVHHINSYKNYPDERIDPENGVALCKYCHQKYHSAYGMDANRHNFNEFMVKFGVE